MTSWAEKVQEIEFPIDLLIGGVSIPAKDGERMDAVSPIDGRILCRVAMGGAEDIDRAVIAARTAFESGCWSGLAPIARKAILLRWADKCEENAEELALLISLEMGKPADEALNVEIRAAVTALRWFAEAVDKITDEIPHTDPGALALVRREAAGVVGAVVPWNFPLTMAAWKVAPALAAGCTVVLKPAEQSPLSALRFAELALESGLPAGVLNVVNGYGETAGEALGRHEDVDILTFTGSTKVGRLFMRYASESNLKRVWLELGGKSANIIFPDADVEEAARVAAWSIFFNQGEMCTAGSRLLVHESIHDRVIEIIREVALTMQPGDPLRTGAAAGALASAEHLENVTAMVEKARAESGEPVLGGRAALPESGGYYFEPTVFDRVHPKSFIAQNEVFGPVLAVMSFSDEAEAIQMANDTRYGLASAVWTKDLDRAHRVARKLKTGLVWVNCYEEGDMTVPFGGVKESGFGRDKSLHALEKFFDLKTTWIKFGS